MKLLYIYDHENWALHNVGKLWLDGISDLETTYASIRNFQEIERKKFDIIWYGFFGVFWKQIDPLAKPSFFDKFPPLPNIFSLHKSVISIHDPCELFPLKQNWHEYPISKKASWVLKHVKGVVTASEELSRVLSNNEIMVRTIPTLTSLPPVEPNEIKTGSKCSIYAVFNSHPRKNMALMERIKDHCVNVLHIPFDYKQGLTILAEKEYIAAMDAHEIYICTSIQEGGPLPAMDAMVRGAVVLTTPVGQMPEIIEHGKSGFFCRTEQEFIDVIKLLSADADLLHAMRLASREAILSKRSRIEIQKKVRRFLLN